MAVPLFTDANGHDSSRDESVFCAIGSLENNPLYPPPPHCASLFHSLPMELSPGKI
jgi:hypothetical protein